MSNIGSLGWSEDKESQSLMVKVTGWDCQLKVEGGNGPHKRNFSWEGLVSRPEKGFAGTESFPLQPLAVTEALYGLRLQ
jgi:hypothetical protein